MFQAQALAAELIADVLAGRSLREERLRDATKTLSSQAGQLRDLTLGTLRWLGQLRALTAQLATRGIADPRLEALLCVALHQLLQDRTAPHAVVDHAVQAARHLGHGQAAGFVNAALRRFLRERVPLTAKSVSTVEGRWSHPEWWVRVLEKHYGDAAAGILEAGLGHPPMTLRVNQRRGTRDGYLADLTARGIAARVVGPDAITLEKPMPVSALPGYEEGKVTIQDAGAQWAARLLGLAPGQRVLDACAAPGGKTGHLLESCDIDLTALDADAARLPAVSRGLDRLGLSAAVRQADASQPGRWWDGRPFDRVLLDAPCSASGIVRRHPDAKWLRRPEDIARFAKQQLALLQALWQVLAPGGKLLYVTCSVFPGENAGVVASFLELTTDVRRLPLPDDFPGRDGQLLPDTTHDGFFYALLERSRLP